MTTEPDSLHPRDSRRNATRDTIHANARRDDAIAMLRLTEAELDRAYSDLEELAEELVAWAQHRYGYRDFRFRLTGLLGERTFELARGALERRALRQPRGEVEAGRERVTTVVADTLAAVRRHRARGGIRPLPDDHVRPIARIAAELALGLTRNPDRNPPRYG